MSELEKLESANVQLTTYDVTVQLEPPFYEGPVPFTYELGREPGIEGPYGTMIDVYHDFGEWRNEFFYDEGSDSVTGLASGARTIESGTGRVLAEAILVEIDKGEGFLVEEFHYRPDGKVSFHCQSRYSLSPRWKQDESGASGTKLNDYYFFWSDFQ